MATWVYGQQIWDFLLEDIGNEYGVSAIMGNLAAESGMIPYIVQGDTSPYTYSREYTNDVDSGDISEYDFVNNGPNGGGYGLAQWTSPSRKQGLYDLKITANQSIGSINLGLEYLVTELKNSYPSVYDEMQNATDINSATVYFLWNFENPASYPGIEADRQALANQVYTEYHGSAFVPRFSKEGMLGAKYWYSNTNPFYASGLYGLPNCTCYAWGRFWEISDIIPNLPTSNGGQWWADVSGYEKGQTPELGAVICFDQEGQAGHVAIVEDILPNGDIRTSNSGYSRNPGGYNDPLYFWVDTNPVATNYRAPWEVSGGYVFQGFIYQSGTPKPPKPPTKRKSKWWIYLKSWL